MVMQNPLAMTYTGDDRDRGDRDRGRRDGRGWGWGGFSDWDYFGLRPFPFFPYPYVQPLPLALAAPPYVAPYGLPTYAPVQAAVPAYATPTVTAGADMNALAVSGIVAPLGFKSRRIRKHQRRTVVARPCAPYQPMTLFIPRHVAKHFEIESIRVGNRYLLGSRDGVTAELYANEGSGPALIQIPPLLPGQHIFMKVKNTSGKSRHFRASLNGLVYG